MFNLTMLTSVEIKDFMDMFQLFHKIKAMESMNQSLSYWMKDILSNDFFINAVFLQYDFYKFTNWTRKVNGGSLVRKIIDDMIDKIEHNSINRRKIFLYGSHELFIASVLQTLKIWKPHIPQYSSAIVIELREYRDKNFVKILYYDGLQSIPKEMQIPGCPSLCPISKFIQLISDQLPNYNEMICDDKPIKL
ncbi:PREDICTED: venom acid phosphatase Acph-1-like [Ceratosolen solmsi marchali]|uniref:acid phosphatase n=1 Tax=Ceratosolen solmsi marchali TaxID=326594 RepID=A0AAJ6YGJ2_9HYME|nr:PREDICTED: venom acid phosphatase Acph-1-like [Ceratosolen solmsi marchali]